MQLTRFQKGYTPVLISNAGSGVFIPPEIAATMTAAGLEKPDTDWFLTRICDFPAIESAAMVSANVANCVVDVNAPATAITAPTADRFEPVVCRTATIAGDAIYRDTQEPSTAEISKRVEHYWQPFHDQLENELTRLIEQFGFVVLIDLRAIPKSAPRWFDGEIASFNFNTLGGQTCSPEMQQLIEQAAARIEADQSNGWSVAIDNRLPAGRLPAGRLPAGQFPLGEITRRYGADEPVQAVQIGLDRGIYLEDDDLSWAFDLAQEVRPALELVIVELMKWAERRAR